ncbi:MAG: hypothetical protein ACJ71Q_06105 [Terriglobales bacterium]
MQKDLNRLTEGQKLLKQLREEYDRPRTQRTASEPATVVGGESYLEPSVPNSVS